MKRWTFDENTIILPNGLKVITIKKDTRLASINIGVNIGSLYEDEKELGMSHFVEHMLFKGTKNRSNEQLNRELEFLGGDYNAYTDYISTVYSITCLDEEFEKGIELLSDMVLNSSFDEKEMKKEKGVVLSEIKSDKDDIEDLSISRTHEYAFDKSALRNSIAGTEEHVKGFKRKQVYDFYKKYYTPDNCVIVTVSAFSHEQMQKIITDLFGKWEGKSHKKAKIIKEENKNIVKTTYKSQIEQGTVTYLYAFKEVCEKDKLPLKILSYKLAESSNSILFRELREERGLAYDVYSQMDLDENVNTMNIFTSVREESIDEVIEVIDKAIVPKIPVKPNKIMNIAIAGVLGVMISLFVIFLLEYMDNKIKSPQDIQKYLELPLLGVVPDEYKGKRGGNKK